MLALSSTASKGSIRPAASCRISRTAVPVKHLNASKSRRTLRKLGSGTTSTESQEARDTALLAAPGDGDYAIDDRSAALAKRAAAIASKLIQQREQAGAAAQTTKTPLDKSLTSLLTSLLGTLADATNNITLGAPGSAPTTPSPGTNPSSGTKPPGINTVATPDGLVQLLTQWADEFLASEGTLPDSKEVPGSSPIDPAAVAKTLFMQLLAELLPPTDSRSAAPAAGHDKSPLQQQQQQQQQQPSLGRGLLAATAAAFTAREAANRLQQRLQADSGSTDNAWSVNFAVNRTTGSTTDSFDPDAWEEAAEAAAEAADAEPNTPTITSDMAAAAVASNTRDFSPDAWELAAAAAAAAAEDEQSHQANRSDRSDFRLPLPHPCWAISTLSEVLQAATAAAVLYRSRSGSTMPAGTTVPSVQQLLLLPASEAAQQLLQLGPVDRAGLLLLLCGAEQPAPLTKGNDASAAAAAIAARFSSVGSGFGSRGDAWLLMVLEGVSAELGLVETGVLLAAVYNKYNKDVFLRAARSLLPLTDTTDPSIALAPATTPPAAAALQALLLHWLLAPQLAAVGLPLLPEPLLLQLLPQAVSACNLRQVTQAAKWGALWPLTQLQDSRGEATVGMPATSSSSSGGGGGVSWRLSKSDWQLAEPQVESVMISSAWCGFTGVPLPWLAHVAAAAAAKLLHGTSSSSSSSSAQLSQGAAAAANDARAVLNALIRGLEPAEPLLLLLMQAIRLLQPGLAGVAAGSTAEGVWKQQLQELLLQAYSGTGLPVVSHADVIHRSLCCMWRPGSAAAAAVGDDLKPPAAPSMQQQQVLDAAAAVLISLPPDQLQQELHTLLSLHQDTFRGQAGRSYPHTAALSSILAATAAAADADQAAAMLAALPMPFWADAWATYVSPAAGCFCWSRQQLVVQLQAVLPSAAAAAAGQTLNSSSSSSWEKVKAAWEVVAAHLNLQAVVQELSTRPKVPAATVHSTSSTSSSGKVDPSNPFDSSKPYSYKPGVPFVGDGWDQADDDSSPVPDYVTASPAPFSGSLGVFVSEVLSRAPLAVAATHIAALAEALPAQGLARVAAVLLPRLVSALDNTTPLSSSSSSCSCTPELHSMAKGLLKLYGSFPELPEAPYAMQLLATAAPHLPLDRLPQLITSSSGISTQLKQMPWVPGAQPMTNPTYTGLVIPGGDHPNYSSSELVESSPELTPMRQLELVVAAAAAGRDGVALQHMLAMLVRQLPLREAHVAFRVLQGSGGAEGARHQQLPYAAAKEASSVLRRRCDEAAAATAAAGSVAASAAGGADESDGTQGVKEQQQQQQQGLDREVVWQFGQSAAAADTPAAAGAALGEYVQGWDSPWSAAASSSGGSSGSNAVSSGSSASDRELIRKLAELVAEVPAAPPAGSWPMDAMHSPSYTAPLLKRILALLVDWTPSCPAAAALAAQQLNTLATKRAWTAAEASAFLQRLPLHTALQLLLESDNTSSSSSSSSKKLLLVRLRPKLLRALCDWQGGEGVVQGLRELLVGYSGLGVVSFVELLSDLKLALSGPSAAAAEDAASNAYVAAVTTVLEVLLPPCTTTSSSSSSIGGWSQKLAQILARVSLEVPAAAAARLAEQIGRSFAHSQQKPGSTAAAAVVGWHADVATLLAALPAAQDSGWDWVPVATAIATAVAEAAGSTAVLSVIRYTFQAAVQLPERTARSAWGAELATVLGQLQAQGVLTCGVAYTMNTLNPGSSSSSSSLGGRFGVKPGLGQTVPSCISTQLQQLLYDLCHADRAISLQQAATALLSVQEGLGKALPMTVATVLGGGKMLGNARGYQALCGGMGTDCAEAAAALDAAMADVAGKFQPTAAALPAAVAAAARQLSEALARCHELMPEDTMAAVMAAVAAVLPWTDVTTTTSSSSSSGVTCPAELAMSQGGWSGVTQVLLITSSLLTASCRVWGVDKGTQVAASLIAKLTTPPPPAAAADTDGRPSKLPRSQSASEMQRVGLEPGSGRFRRSVSTGSLGGPAFSSSSSSSHAARAEAALFRATIGGARPGAVSHAEGAAAKMRAAAATGGTAQPGSQADRAGAALMHGASTSSSSSSSMRVANSHASRAESKLLHAATASGGDAVPGSHAGKAKAALLQAAATGLLTSAAVGVGGGSSGSAGREADSHAQHAQHALVQALASGNTATAAADAGTPSAAAAAATVDAELAAWVTDQLLSAADAWYWPGLVTAKGLVHGILYPKYYSIGTAAAAAAVGPREATSKSVSQLDVLTPCEAATALGAALPRLATDLPSELTAEVLGQIWGLVPSATWTRCLNATSAAVAAAPAVVTGTAAATAQAVGGTTGGVRQLQQLLQRVAISLHQQLEPSRDLPAAYAGLLCAAASKLPEGSLSLLLQQMLTGGQKGREGVHVGYECAGFSHGVGAEGLTSEGVAQLLQLLLSPGVIGTTSSSSSTVAAAVDSEQEQQLALVATVASAVFDASPSSSSSGTTAAAADVAAALAGRLYQADVLPRTYLTLLLQPYLSTAQREVCVKQLGLTTGAPETSAAVAALQTLCNTLNPGRKIPLASYAQVLAAALNVTRVQDYSGVGFTGARVGLELERQQTLQLLLTAVVHVLGTFRGMRKLYASPLGAQIVLPMHDLAAVLCYSWQLVPADAATALAEAVAAALGKLDGHSQAGGEVNGQLTTVLQLLPNAAAEGFGKGAELWRPLLHVMAVAGGLSEPQESSLTQKLLAVSLQQQVPSYPLRAGSSSSSSGGFADPAAVTAALSGAAAVNDVGLSAGRVSGGTAGGHTAAEAEGVTAADADAAGGEQQQQQQQQQEEEEEKEEVTEADAALLTTAAAAYLCAALTGFTPLVVFMGSMSTLLVAALGATQTANNSSASSSSSSKYASKATNTDTVGSSVTSGAADSPPATPRTPTTTDTISSSSSSSSSSRRHAAMGGRTKVTFAHPAATAASTDAGAIGDGAAAAATAAAVAGARGGVWALGSLAVDPDDVIKKIKGHAAQLPLDEALMEVVPLLLLPADASSYTWPLLALSAILHSKFPRLHTLLGPGGASLINMALAATFVNPDGPLAAVMNASQLLAESDSSSSSSSSRDVGRDELSSALAAAEGVHPHGVARQLAERLLNALWAVLSNSGTAVGSTVAPPGSTVGTAAGGTTGSAVSAVSTPEGAAAVWQEIAVHLLTGVEGQTAVKLLSGFAHRQQGNWEAQLRALAVAAVLQGSTHSSSSSSGDGQGLLAELLGQVCGSNNYPPLSFLSLLLRHGDIPLSSSDDTAAVLNAAFEQLIASYGTRLLLPGANSTSSSSGGSSRRGSLWGDVGMAGDFDNWAEGLLADQGLDQALSGSSSSSRGPRYRATSSFTTTTTSSSSSGGGDGSTDSAAGFAAPRAKVSPVPQSVLGLVESVVKGACSRGHAVAALRFLTRVLAVTRTISKVGVPQAENRVDQGPLLVVEGSREQQLLQLVLTAVDSSLGRGQDQGQTAQSSAAAAAAAAGNFFAAADTAAGVMVELVEVLGDAGHLDYVNAVTANVCKALAEQYRTGAVHSSSSSSSWASAESVGQVLTSAAEAVRKSEGVLSAAKPAGGLFVATAADALFGDRALSVEQCLVLLAAVAAHMPERLGLQIVAAAAGRLHSVMPQAVGIVRQVAVGP